MPTKRAITPIERITNDQRYIDQIPKTDLYNADGTPTALLLRMQQMRERAGFVTAQVQVCRVSMRKVHRAALAEQEQQLRAQLQQG